MSEAERLADELDDTPNWQKEKWGSQWKHSTMTYSRVPFEAAAELRRLSAELEGHKAARMAYASEFPLNEEGEPDVGSIHQNIRVLKAELAALKKAQGVPDKTGTTYADLHAKWRKGRQELANLTRAHEKLKVQLASAPPAPQAAVCKGDWMLGTACGKCSRCIETKPAPQAEELLQWKARALQAEAIVAKFIEVQTSEEQQTHGITKE